MLIRNVQDHDLYTALDAANAQFAGNITFKRLDTTNRAGTSHRVTLTVLDSHNPGSRRSPNHWRRISTACWHAHRAFLSALPPQAEVISSLAVESHNGHVTTPPWHPGEPFLDRNIGSNAYPCMASEACDCGPYQKLTPWRTTEVERLTAHFNYPTTT